MIGGYAYLIRAAASPASHTRRRRAATVKSCRMDHDGNVSICCHMENRGTTEITITLPREFMEAVNRIYHSAEKGLKHDD